MNWIDYFIIAVFIFYIFEGVRRGFIEQVLELVGFFATIFLALWVYRPLSGWVVSNLGAPANLAEPIAFFIVWLGLQALYSLALHFLYPLVPETIRTAVTNRLVGIVPSFFKAFILVAVVMTILVELQIPQELRNNVDSSALGSRFVGAAPKVEIAFAKIFGRSLKDSLTIVTIPPQRQEIIQPDERRELGFTCQDGKADKQSEQRLFDLVNQERAKVGLATLKWDEKLAEVGRAHDEDMFAKGYFAHVNLEGQDPFVRMKEAGISYKVAGENLALAPTVVMAHSGLMNSEGHRENILNTDFGHIGIGVVGCGNHSFLFAQEFTD